MTITTTTTSNNGKSQTRPRPDYSQSASQRLCHPKVCASRKVSAVSDTAAADAIPLVARSLVCVNVVLDAALGQ
eukprot:360049-Chlamydomonas_euryale.AAC.6